MLNRAKVLKELSQLSAILFVDNSPAYNQLAELWDSIVGDSTFIYKVRQSVTPWPVPVWYESLSNVYTIAPKPSAYYALSIDGSQIYPDRHYALSCCLINIGTILLPYGMTHESVRLQAEPYIFYPHSVEGDHFSTDFVNNKRQELELETGLKEGRLLKEKNVPSLVLFDGSLIFWHLDAQDTALRDEYLARYLGLLHQYATDEILLAGYISMPKSKELINLVRLYASDFKPEDTERYAFTDRMVDTAIAGLYVQPGQRTIVFKNCSTISKQYPLSIAPHFFYLNVGAEIARIEIPAWIAHDSNKVDLVASIVLDQATKGQGYPIAIAEAHEQAVVKGPDRDFFYHLLMKLGIEYNQRIVFSSKSIKKRGIGI